MSEKNTHRKIFIIGGIAAFVMFAFCFAMVPLYSLLCKKTGLNTTLSTELTTPADLKKIDQGIDKKRDIQIQFTSTNHMGMPWDFFPRTKIITIHPGEKNKVFFYAKNTTTHKMVAQAIPSMTPSEAVTHFHKIECFCFNRQTLNGKESKDMALVFEVDRAIPKDVKVITLAYTLFDASPKETRKG